MYGTSGIRMPNPSVSMMLKRNSAPSCRFKLRRGLRSVPRNDSREVTRTRSRWHEITHTTHDDVGNARFIEVLVPAGRGAQHHQMQRRNDPQEIALTAVERICVGSHVGRLAPAGGRSEAQRGAKIDVGGSGLAHQLYPARADDLVAAIVALTRQQLTDAQPVTLARHHA